jgi:hypothetical protein
VDEEIAPLDAIRRADLHQSARSAAIVARLAVAETALVEVDDGARERFGGQESST